MATFDEAMNKLADEEGEILAAFRKRARQFFEDFYPKLTPDEIQQALELHTAFNETEIEIIQSFYETTSYSRTARELRLDPHSPQARIRNTLLQALTRLPEDSPLHTALQMAFAHRNIRQEPGA